VNCSEIRRHLSRSPNGQPSFPAIISPSSPGQPSNHKSWQTSSSTRPGKHRYAACLSFALESDRCTNNVAEYEAVILGLCKLRALGVTTCIIRTDSKVVAGQIEKDYAAKDPALMQYLAAVHSLERQFKGFTLQHVD
jgi:hypothetical protein